MKRILVVEDSPTQAEYLGALISAAHPELEVCQARNGIQALEMLHDTRPSLVISDIVMPLMDGYSMCYAIKSNPVYQQIPVILLTSLSDPEDIIRGLNAGTDYYLTKPFEEDLLLSKVESILEFPAGSQEDGEDGWRVTVSGREHVVHADLQQMLNLLLSTYENAVQKNRRLLALQDELQRTNESLEERVRQRTSELSAANERLLVEVGERKRAEQRLYQQLQRLDALRHIDIAISGSLDLGVTLNVILDQVISQLKVDAANVLLLRPGSIRLEFAAGRGFKTPAQTLKAHNFTRGPAGEAVQQRQMVRIAALDPARSPLPDAVLRAENFGCYVAVPLIAKGRPEGVLEVYSRRVLSEDTEWTAFLEALAGQAAIAIDSALLFEDLQRSNTDLLDAYESTLEGWSKALDLRDRETEGHTLRVTEMSDLLARKMGMPPVDLIHLRRGALLHDIGKLGVPDAILRKPGPLDEEERRIMQEHTTHAYAWLSSISFLRPAVEIPHSHHEKWDGTGYPRALKQDQIPLAARIFAVADVWDALRSDRPYRKPWSRRRCLEYILSQSGTHFDPSVVASFAELVQEMGDSIDQLWDPEE